jgi:hypothetical protein
MYCEEVGLAPADLSAHQPNAVRDFATLDARSGAKES